ncbi:MAG: response regulator, partial [Pseudomonadota bacterium]
NAHRQDISLVLSDISMAGVDGLEMLRRLKAIAPEVPMVVMSGRIDERQQQRMAELKLQHVVHKPFTRGELLAVLRQALPSR